ncbi:hypothetical protein TRFO_18092 [Tritrichomonas foetus]|uniref:Uncharacterized protein n=1 Tax=Tritrichomonas foetus TaxID=1144522 RepID=A0A1J4KM31_9EUKA|nr:hypothetical protein TRFO_18092 [Tritrichomonas foetus]|eukprot:OHT12194.1 hypothetical protein TRFO_18092 [Tritrichomonas foetus]
MHITEIKNEYAKASQELEEVQKQEDMLFQEKLNLSEKERLIDTRRLQAMQMMADPIDSLSYEEEIVKDAERDAETTEKRFSAKNPILLDDDFSKEISTISLLENENSKRKAILDKKKESVENIKSSFPQNDINYSNKNPKKEKNLSAQQNISTTDMHNVVDQISQRLQKKQKEIDEQEREIDQLSAQNAISRKQKTKIYEEQMKKVEDLNKKCREIELLLLNIDEVGELNEEKRQTVSELETRIAQLKRRIDNAERDKNLNSSNNKQLQILRQKYEDHKKEIEENAERINEMRLSIDELQKIVDESGKALKKRESDVVQLEDQLKVVEAKISQTVETLHNEEDKLDDLLKRMPNAQSEAEDFSDILRKSTELL